MPTDFGSGVGRNEMAAVLFLAAINETMQAYGTLNSSPWTAESFGADDRRAAALKEYVTHAVIFSSATALIAARVANGTKATVAILAGVALTNAYLVWLYIRASRRGREAGDTGWANKS
jgi:Flp pilus assembly protein TadB